MIKKNELRIGNCVRVYDFYCTITHLGESTTGYRVMDNKTGCTYDLIKPIELTEDILIKCGFEIPAEDGFFQRVCNGVVKIKIDKTIKLPVVLIGGTILTHILYLHQLQNLYFALNGEELQINCNLFTYKMAY